ncbi:MAG: hypothetical protein IPF62_10400 [Bacteroidetes bacterium]|nr:hypothetical protein [Bacteroidota bacterium]
MLYAGKLNVCIRIRANTGTSFTSDMAVDDITVFEPVQNDLTHASVIAGGGCGNSNLTPVIIQLVNTGVDTIDVGTYTGFFQNWRQRSNRYHHYGSSIFSKRYILLYICKWIC